MSHLRSNIYDLTSSFRLWLESKNYSPSTIRNYFVDLNKYLASADHSLIFSANHLRQYISSISSDKNYRRQLSSLNKFFHFALDQHLITKNPLKSALKPLPLQIQNIIKMYQSYLTKKNKNPLTIKNYLNDIQQFINWSEALNSNPNPTLSLNSNPSVLRTAPLNRGAQLIKSITNILHPPLIRWAIIKLISFSVSLSSRGDSAKPRGV